MAEEELQEKNYKFCSGFWLKIIAIITMTIDHIGAFLETYGLNSSSSDILRIIGRIAMPLFCFMIVEGVIHTKSFKKYILRLSILAIIISTFILILGSWESLGFTNVKYFGNIFLDLIAGAGAIYSLKQKGKKKLFIFIPIAYILTFFIVNLYEYHNSSVIHWFPYFLRPQYGIVSFVIMLGFYAAYYIKDLFFKMHTNQLGIPEDSFSGTSFERTVINVSSFFLLTIFTLIFHFGRNFLCPTFTSIQIYAIIAGAFILLYNGKRGYNSKWFEYGSYAYYPLHIAIIALIFYLITL